MYFQQCTIGLFNDSRLTNIKPYCNCRTTGTMKHITCDTAAIFQILVFCALKLLHMAHGFKTFVRNIT